MILTPDTYSEQEEFINLFKDCVDEVVVNQYSEEVKKLNSFQKLILRNLKKKLIAMECLMILLL